MAPCIDENSPLRFQMCGSSSGRLDPTPDWQAKVEKMERDIDFMTAERKWATRVQSWMVDCIRQDGASWADKECDSRRVKLLKEMPKEPK